MQNKELIFLGVVAVLMITGLAIGACIKYTTPPAANVSFNDSNQIDEDAGIHTKISRSKAIEIAHYQEGALKTPPNIPANNREIKFIEVNGEHFWKIRSNYTGYDVYYI